MLGSKCYITILELTILRFDTFLKKLDHALKNQISTFNSEPLQPDRDKRDISSILVAIRRAHFASLRGEIGGRCERARKRGLRKGKGKLGEGVISAGKRSWTRGKVREGRAKLKSK